MISAAHDGIEFLVRKIKAGPKIVLQNKSICFHVKFSSPLNVVDVDCGVTKEARQGDGSDLGQLVSREADVVLLSLVPEPVTPPHILELEAEETAKSGADQCPLQPLLRHEACEQVDVVRVMVDGCHVSEGEAGEDGVRPVESLQPGEATQLAIVIVAAQPVVSPSLDVESHQVHTRKFLPPFLKQMICHLGGKFGIHSSHRH